MADNIAVVNLEWLIALARKGDGEQLAEALRSKEQRDRLLRIEGDAAELLWSLLADALTGKIPKPKKRTWLAKDRRWFRERAVARSVDAHMGKRRDVEERALWTRKLCEVYDTTPNNVAAFKRSARKRRR